MTDVQSAAFGKLGSEKAGLVEPPFPQATAMQRHGYQQGIWRQVAEIGRHIVRHGLRQPDLAPVLEPHRQAPRNVIINHRRSCPADSRRAGEAGSAFRGVGRLQRDAAAGASALHEFDRSPAVDAKGVLSVDDITASGTARGQGEIQCCLEGDSQNRGQLHALLFPSRRPRTSAAMAEPIFDMRLRALRRDRAATKGPVTFLHDRAFDDIVERLQVVNRTWETALLLGCPNAEWPARLSEIVGQVTVADPGFRFAETANGQAITEDAERLGDADFDLCIAIGTLDTVNDVALAFRNIWAALRPDSLLIGAVSGGDTVPKLRRALRAADSVTGEASPHVHPRFDGPSLGAAMTQAGFLNPVVDVDRVSVRYRSFGGEIADLRGMAATNILLRRSSKPLLRRALLAAETDYGSDAQPERFEILHFAAWTAAE